MKQLTLFNTSDHKHTWVIDRERIKKEKRFDLTIFTKCEHCGVRYEDYVVREVEVVITH